MKNYQSLIVNRDIYYKCSKKDQKSPSIGLACRKLKKKLEYLDLN